MRDKSESVPFAHARRHIFAWRGPFKKFSKCRSHSQSSNSNTLAVNDQVLHT